MTEEYKKELKKEEDKLAELKERVLRTKKKLLDGILQ